MRIAAIHRGSGPRDLTEAKWESFDLHLQRRAVARGARLVPGRVDRVEWTDGRPRVGVRGGDAAPYDLLAVAAGVNSSTLQMFENLGIGYRRPEVTKTVIREYFLGQERVTATLGTSMHVFLLDLPRLEFAAVIPKGDYVTICLLGRDADNDLIEAFVRRPEVQECMPAGWRHEDRSCQCFPHMSVRGAAGTYADRLVFIGDCGVTRLYKDGVGAAYRTAKAAARTAVFDGISAEAFRRRYGPACRRIVRDNQAGRLAFSLTRLVQKTRPARRALLRATREEQMRAGRPKRLSAVLWDMFSGSAPYRDIFARMMHPAVAGAIAWSFALGAVRPDARASKEARG